MPWGVSSNTGADMDLDKLQRRVNWSTGVALATFVVVVLAYAIKISWLSGGVLADSSDAWGQFGDYIGGLLNPLIAFLAFYWLTQSVLLQKQELAETKDALKESAKSQSKQALLAAKTAEISALSAILASCNSDLARFRDDSRFALEQLMSLGPRRGLVRMPDGRRLENEGAEHFVAEKEASIIDVLARRQWAIDRLREALEERENELALSEADTAE